MLRTHEQLIADTVTTDETVRLVNGGLAKRVNVARLFDNDEAFQLVKRLAEDTRDFLRVHHPGCAGMFVESGGRKLSSLFPDAVGGVAKNGTLILKREDGKVEAPSVYLIEDVLTTGGSTIRAIEALATEGVPVVLVFAVVDRGIGARRRIESKGITVVTAAEVNAYDMR